MVGVRPYPGCLVAGEVLAVAGIEEVHVVNHAVAVEVVVGEVDFAVELAAYLYCQFVGAHVVAVGVVFAVICSCSVGSYRPVYVKLRQKLSHRLCAEVVGRRAYVLAAVEPLEVEHLVEFAVHIGCHEFHVGEVYQEHQRAHLAGAWK